MHQQVLDWIGQFRTTEDLAVLDIGGRDLNGSPRMFFPNAKPYHVLDLRPGANVDIVADAATWEPDRQYDLVICTEVFEHDPAWPQLISAAGAALRPGGWFLFTCAGPGRPPHSGIAAQWELIGDEHYANVSPEQIAEELARQGWTEIETRQLGLDTQGKAIKPEPREVELSAVLTRTTDPNGDPYRT